MLVVGVTGQIASGKSTVAEMFERLGAKVIDADAVAKRLLWRNSPCFQKICRAFGPVVLTDGRLDRGKLAKVVFADKAKRRRLERIIHPQVAAEFKKRLEKYRTGRRQKVVIMDVPLLFESGMDRLADVTVAVKAGKEQQISRAMRSRRISRGEIEARQRAQMPLNDKIRRADFCIDNSGTKLNTQRQVKGLWLKLQQTAKK